MISIDPAAQGDRDNYKLLIGSVVPRPIAFVTTLSKQGVLNGAPFSYFSIVSSNPPLLSVAVQRKNGVMKDTARNAVATGELVIHIVDETNVAAINETAANLPPDESEITIAGLTATESEKVNVPGIAESKIRMECVLEQALELGGTGGSPGCDLLIARVVRFQIAKEILENGRIDAQKLAPVSRMAGNFYSSLGSLFEIERPQ
ncbi:flavin reductase family protein [Paenibacillus sp. CF384]|uniref:flavin reductase family protein n=1 Tax=Paenibacillus sp. CF384 TaxID=1884382 RepID=UPI00089C4DC0|nr:flavin reductase family protein [Paenibacillus sp. CF384]SDX94378.1 NADH-FMN oxidoreductase RutF, flavin reductase (DIM6/NTAB) family [Paenibacillus sp. CF384]